jgi:hypothetical protein
MTVWCIISFLGTIQSMEFSYLDSTAPKNSRSQRLSGIVKHLESWTYDDDEFVFAWNSLSLNMALLLTLHKCENNRRVSLSLITYDTASALAPSEFRLFPKLKEHLRGHHCTSDDEVKTVVKLWFRHQDAQFCRDGGTKLLDGSRKCVDRVGDCVEK